MKTKLFSYLNGTTKWNILIKKVVGYSLAIGTVTYLYHNLPNKNNILCRIKPTKITLAEEPIKYVLPERVPYLVVGGGPSGYSAAMNITINDPNARVVVITSEKYLPYMRPILSKELWLNEYSNYDKFENCSDPIIFVNDEATVDIEKLFDPQLNSPSIAYLRNSKVIELNTDIREVTLCDGRKIKFNKIVLATGSEPQFQDVFNDLLANNKSQIINYNTIDDFLKLHQTVVSSNKTIVVIDNGVLGVELCSSLINSTYKKYNNQIIMLFPQQNLLSNILPEYLANDITQTFRENGVNIINNVDIVSAEECTNNNNNNSNNNNKILLKLSNNHTIEADIIVDCSTYKIKTDFIEGEKCVGKACPKKLCINDDSIIIGYKTNPLLQSGGCDIFVCGTAASVFDPIQDTYNQISCFVHAIDSAEAVARNITNNKPIAYNNLPIYWLKIFDDDIFDFVGIVDSSLPTCSVWRESSIQLELDNTNLPNNSTKKNHKNINPINAEEELPYSYFLRNFSQGVIFYYKNDTVVGIVTKNLNHPIGLSDKIIRGQIKGEDPKELAKYFFAD